MASDVIVASVLEKSTLGCAVEPLLVGKKKKLVDNGSSGLWNDV